MITEKLKGRKGSVYLCAFLLPFLMMQIFWAVNGVYPFGDNSILTGDMDLEFVNFYGYFINTFRSKSDWSYMLAKTLGGDFPGLAAFQLHDPLLLILFLFPGEHIAAGIELVFTLQVSLAGLSMSFLLNGRIKRSWMSILFSTAYAFSGFFFGYLVLTIYFGCLALLPLLVYFFLKYLDDGKYLIPYVLLTAFYIYMNFHMGFMLVIFLCIFYVSRIISDGSYLKRLSDFILSGISILLMDGFFLIRTGLSLLGEKTTEGADYGFYRRFAMNQVFAGFFSGCSQNELMPLIYCSLAAVFFALIYLISGRVDIRSKIADIFVITAIMVSMWINTLDAVWHGFNNPEGFYFRYAFLISFMVIVMGYKGAVLLISDNEEGIGKPGLIRVAAAAGILILYMIWLRISGNIYLDIKRFIINLAVMIMLIISVLFILGKGKAKLYGSVFLMIISMADMLHNSVTAYKNLNLNGTRPPRMSEFKEDYTSINDVISYIKKYDNGFYRIEKDFDRAVNDPALFDYMGMSHDSSCEKDEIIDWLNNFGFPRTVYYTYYNNGGTAFTDSFFGIRYYVSRFDETAKPYVRLPYEGKYYAYYNEYALPLAYIAPEGLPEYDLEDEDIFIKQNRLAEFWGTHAPIYKEAEYEMRLEGTKEESAGCYRKTNDRGYVIYNVRISEDMPLYIYFPAPKRQGANLIINGEDMGRYFSENHWNVVYAGTYRAGDNVEIRLELLDDEIELLEPCFYYEDASALDMWKEAAGALNTGISSVEEVKSSHLRFTTKDDKENRIIMSIPYDKGWKITCDGKRINADAALQVLLSINVPSGEHTIEMKYIPHGTVVGIIVSAAGLVMFLYLCFVTLKNKADDRENTADEA